MTGAVAESWARLRLVQGDSSAQVWELVASRGQTTLTVGSGPSSSWVIREEGVRPLHFSLHWDGATLRIADTYGAGDVRVDGVQVTAQWKAIVGRARVDFGKAAMVAETSAGAESEAHPLEPSPLPPIANAAQHKATLMGVSPLAADPPVELVTLKADSSAPKADSAAAQAGPYASTNGGSVPPGSSDSSPPADGTGSFRVSRPSDSERARKGTLMGIAISVPPPAPVPDVKVLDAPEAAVRAEESKKGEPKNDEPKRDEPRKLPSQGIPSGTLIGVVGPLEARVQRLASQDGNRLSDKRTMLGVPLKDLRIEPPQAQPNGEAPAIVTQAEVRTVSATPVSAPPAERIGSTWQEIPNASRPISQPPMAVLVEPARGAAQTQRRIENDVAPPRLGGDPRGTGFDPRDRGFDPRARAGGFDPRASSYDRVSDIPTQMRDVASLDSRRPKRTIPLRYIGIVVLTAAAYMAWLYLLDHL
jgi:hypothetical protein